MAKRVDLKIKLNKTIIASVAIAAVTLFIGVVVIYTPFLNKKKTLRAEILEERGRNVLIGEIRALGKHLNVYNKRVSEQKGVSWLLSEVSDMALKEEIELSSIKPGPLEDQGLYTKLYVILDISSTYDQLGRFIASIESSEKFLRVEEIDIKRLDLDEDFDEEIAKFKAFDTEGHIVVSAVFLKE